MNCGSSPRIFAANVFAVAVRASDDLFRRRSAGHQDAVELLAAFFSFSRQHGNACPELQIHWQERTAAAIPWSMLREVGP